MCVVLATIGTTIVVTTHNSGRKEYTTACQRVFEPTATILSPETDEKEVDLTEKKMISRRLKIVVVVVKDNGGRRRQVTAVVAGYGKRECM